jgi:NAD(P)-dependent dehydrogenase (short-subunit alcohol dehydrogenase family)
MEKQNSKNDLNGKKVILLGGSSGIGLATAKAAAEEGATIIIVSSNQKRIDEALKHLPESSAGYVVDLSKEENIKAFFNEVANFDHLIYTAGENINLGIINETELEFAKQYFNIRYWGAFTAVKYAHQKLNKGGSITLTGGIASQRPGKGWSLGASICAAMEGVTRAMAVELAPIRVNLVSPGVVKTNLWNSLSDQDREGMYEGGANLPVGRVGEAEDIAQTFLYLMKQNYGTGQVITVDGGAVLV